ncbi:MULTISPECIES: NAD(P)-dependent oxidoreductase [Bifidobacterium]|jgi:putative NADH-flavin reductase|uniref:NAD(P)-dependent oxidoreductase n=1 Tax=Bifidobacterium tibiigranuli TaxID=2172043 RepID=A0A5N6S1B5_9BIFI|nr:NAD(P)-binding oxidoreductase [Bifidobacterium tibiigranuli]KAE8127148.1 NAD(P)-dependent oxidoreductase [Bifidobacterium tibiigranuli]KAE8127629.1 NAD(P)-dependent oxidoreductase [Bifidobacterium tibiigranuli]MCI1211259.1 NAD(P)H-binding protein [Bifidobacterium tibiigranuli]MCI1221328.1 NAD(P)H-binding protein [Bifidobacterium tibiigranuli]MCI1232346.1 NAD(P)H-binding protein [Bifidobacterium tibiigranuli]
MKLVVIGANGATGMRIVNRALAQGHEVTAVVRREDAESPAGAARVVADPLDFAALAACAAGHDAILGALGVRSLGRTSLMQRSVAALIDAAGHGAPSRVLVVSAFGVGDTAQAASPFARLLYRTVMRNIFDDKAKAERMLEDSPLEWTVASPGTLSNKPLRPYEATESAKLGTLPGLPSSTRESVADFMVRTVADPTWTRKVAVLRDL